MLGCQRACFKDDFHQCTFVHPLYGRHDFGDVAYDGFPVAGSQCGEIYNHVDLSGPLLDGQFRLESLD